MGKKYNRKNSGIDIEKIRNQSIYNSDSDYSDNSNSPPKKVRKLQNKKIYRTNPKKEKNIEPTEQELLDLLNTSEEADTGNNIVNSELTSKEQNELCKDEYHRFVWSSKKIGHAYIHKDKNKNIVSDQFYAPGSTDESDPVVRQLENIRLINKYGNRRAEATTPNGTEMVGTRSIRLKLTDIEYNGDSDDELWFFSPKSSHKYKDDVFWGSKEEEAKIFKNSENTDITESQKKDLIELEDEIDDIGDILKHGETQVESDSVLKRKAIKTRNPDQNTVMKGSAIDAYKYAYDTYGDLMTDDMNHVFAAAEEARPHYRGGHPRTQRRPEWLHLMGHSLTPISKEPQTTGNLIAADKASNNRMICIEKTVEWHALKRPNSTQSISGQFNALMDLDIMKTGYFQANIKENNREVQLALELFPLNKYPIHSKATDKFQSTLVTHCLLTDKPRAISSKIEIDNSLPKRICIKTNFDITDNIEAEDESLLSNNDIESVPFILNGHKKFMGFIDHLADKYGNDNSDSES